MMRKVILFFGLLLSLSQPVARAEWMCECDDGSGDGSGSTGQTREEAEKACPGKASNCHEMK